MSMVTVLGLMAAVLGGAGAFFVGRTLVGASARYRETFQDTATQNLEEMFLFIQPQKLFAMNVVVLALIFCSVLVVSGSVWLAVLLSALVAGSPPLIYWFLRRQRRRRAVAQLPDALLAIATNMKAGLSVNQALETTVSFEHPPLGQELALTLRELRVGVPFGEALDNLYDRLPEVEVQLVVCAMKVSREIGGNLAETLERIADTLRKRLQMEGKIRSLTAQGKLQGLVMVSLPIFLVLALSQMEPAAMYYLLHAWYGWATIAVIIVMELIGYHFIHKIVSIDV
ncbi:type II secretion system F family protein [Salinisphaera sp.]|uniref:type II secretion system F family protein n=1 Tax=Salinisphaera sp. TaxID=1914330 RepID=UPI002D79FA64|nr:type II secretion system F family protein [Salinisphaera sp.]HET7314081.1 type II secretion system F family protein [Salinisphaera sp.]